MPRTSILLFFLATFFLPAYAQSTLRDCPDGPFKAEQQAATGNSSRPEPIAAEEGGTNNQTPPEIKQIQSGLIRRTWAPWGGGSTWLGYDAERSAVVNVDVFIYSDEVPYFLANRKIESDETLRQFSVGKEKRIEIIRVTKPSLEQRQEITCLINRALAEEVSNEKSRRARAKAYPGEPLTFTMTTDRSANTVFLQDGNSLNGISETMQFQGSYEDYFKLIHYLRGIFLTSNSGINYGSKLGMH